MWRPDDWPDNPCDGCESKEEDGYGLVCALSCDKGSWWITYNTGGQAMLDALYKEKNIVKILTAIGQIKGAWE